MSIHRKLHFINRDLFKTETKNPPNHVVDLNFIDGGWMLDGSPCLSCLEDILVVVL